MTRVVTKGEYENKPGFKATYWNHLNFEIGKAKLSKSTKNPHETISIDIPVKNTGKRDGTEIVQVYVRKVNDIDGPLKTLKGFERVEVPAGKTRQANISLPPSSFGFYDWSQRKMAVTPGKYEVFYGNSSDAKNLKSEMIIIE
jgi:beta-glucosidase